MILVWPRCNLVFLLGLCSAVWFYSLQMLCPFMTISMVL